jgi:hypothetical protein
MGDATRDDAACVHCGSSLRANAPFCTACGHAVTGRHTPAGAATAPAASVPDIASAPADVVGVARGVRCTAYALDLAVLTSPALPLAVTAAIFKVAAVAYVVGPTAFLAGWIWMGIWQALTGMSFGKAMLGLRAIRLTDQRPAPFSASLLRGILFAGTAGVAALPVLSSSEPCDGWHDRLSGITLIDISLGGNPLGPQQQTALRRQIDRSLRVVRSPIPVPSTHPPSATGYRTAVGLA